jgi:hypothetical protein
MALIKLNTRSIPDVAITPAKVSQNLGRRNILRNGAINVAQRGTAFSPTNGQTYIFDGFLATVGSAFNMDTTVTQSSTVPTGEGFSHSIKVTPDSVVSSSGSDNGGIAQRLEVQNVNHLGWGTSSAKSLTLSFWVKSSKTGIYCVQLQQNATASGSEYGHVKEYTIATANTWQKVILTFPGNTTQAITGSDNADGLRVNWWLVCGSSDHTAADSWAQTASYQATSNQVDFMDNTSNTWYMTGCQLESGNNATEFEHRSFGEELAACQRYCNVIGDDAHYTAIGPGTMYTTTNGIFYITTATSMRTTPSTTTIAASSGSNSGKWLNSYVGSTGTITNAVPQLGENSTNGLSNNFRIYVPSSNSSTTIGLGTWNMVITGAKFILSAEL